MASGYSVNNTLMPGERQPRFKATHQEVDFQSPSRHEDEHCSLCKHYIPSIVPRCKLVKSPIKASDYCSWFKERK